MRKKMIEDCGVSDAGDVELMPVLHDSQMRPRPAGREIASVLGDYKLKVQAQQRTASAANAKAHLDPWQKRLAGGGIVRMGHISTNALLADLVWMRETPSLRTGRLRADLTVRTTATAIKVFLGWAYEQGYISKRLLDEYRIPKARKASVYKPNIEDLNKIFQIVDDYWNPELRPEIASWPASILNFYRIRMLAFLLVQMTCGLRVSETCHLELQDWDKVRGTLNARITKSGDPRDVPIIKETACALADWAKIRPRNSPTDYLFTSEVGLQLSGKNMTQTFQRYLAWGRARGFDLPRVTLHSLRHYCISEVVEAAGLHAAQELAGHKDVSTTKLYTHTSGNHVKDAVAKTNLLGGVIVNKRMEAQKKAKPRGKRLFM